MSGESEKRETHADIIAEMRERKSQLEDAIFNAPLCYSTDDTQAKVEVLDEYIDRLESASRRAYNEIDSAVCTIPDLSPEDIAYIRTIMDNTIGDYYE